jgi:hypothetical protein
LIILLAARLVIIGPVIKVHKALSPALNGRG